MSDFFISARIPPSLQWCSTQPSVEKCLLDGMIKELILHHIRQQMIPQDSCEELANARCESEEVEVGWGC